MPTKLQSPAAWSEAGRQRFLTTWWELDPNSYTKQHRKFRGGAISMIIACRIETFDTFWLIAKKANPTD